MIHDNVFQLVYISEMCDPSTQGEVDALLKEARSNNARAGITGLLLLKSGHALQMLEGDETKVFELYEKIARDKRHTNLKILYEGSGSSRYFSRWSMGYRSIEEFDPNLRDRIEDLVGNISRGEKLFNPKDALHLFETMR